MTSILRTHVVSRFSCLGDQCPDTCCRGWSMQVDDATFARYKNEAPELMMAIEPGNDAPWIMRKNAGGVCVKFEDGLCGIHKTHGDTFLGDACHFYPRITRALGEHVIMSAVTSCPEVMRLALEDNDPLALDVFDTPRLPSALKNYLPEGMKADDALAVHRAFLQATMDEPASAERIYMRAATVSRSLERIDKKDWAQASAMYLRLADGRLPPPEINLADPFNLLHALMGLIVATKKPMSERLAKTVADMEKALAVKLDWDNVLIHTNDDSALAYQTLHNEWEEKYAAHFAPLLKIFLRMQFSMALYPFAGLGDTLTERITLIGVRLATLKLAIACACGIEGVIPPQDVVVRVAQSLSRFLDHLGDPGFSLQIYTETGWINEARMRGLLGA